MSNRTLTWIRLGVKKFSLFILFLSLITSCSTKDDSSSIEKLEPAIVQSEEDRGTGGQLVPITSSNVNAAGYDASSKTMTVQFNNGYTYEYYGVSLELWNSFITAQPNPWSLVGYPQLVQADIPYKRIR